MVTEAADQANWGQTVRSATSPQGTLHGEHGGHVGQQAQGQPFQDAHVLLIRMNTCSSSDSGPKPAAYRWVGPPMIRVGVAHGGHVGGNIDDIGQQQQADDGVQQRFRIVAADVRRQAVPLTRPILALMTWIPASGKRQAHRPQHAEAELGARLRIRGDAAGVVIGRARDQAGPSLPSQVSDGAACLRTASARRCRCACVAPVM
jgi:hypothetical protein